eukprot:jgi/Mesvir1/12844/Mv05876-RA.1
MSVHVSLLADESQGAVQLALSISGENNASSGGDAGTMKNAVLKVASSQSTLKDKQRPKSASSKATTPSPFTFHSDKKRSPASQSEATGAAKAESKTATIVARPVPAALHKAPTLPKVEKKTPTKPAPFELPGAKFHEEARRKREQQHNAENANEGAQQGKFKARERPKYPLQRAECWKRISTKPLTIVNGFQLSSETRAARRQSFDRRVNSKEKQQEEAKKAAQMKEESEEAKRRLEIRKQMAFRAQPAPAFGEVFVPKHAAVMPTVPISPVLSTKLRSAAKA